VVIRKICTNCNKGRWKETSKKNVRIKIGKRQQERKQWGGNLNKRANVKKNSLLERGGGGYSLLKKFMLCVTKVGGEKNEKGKNNQKKTKINLGGGGKGRWETRGLRVKLRCFELCQKQKNKNKKGEKQKK